LIEVGELHLIIYDNIDNSYNSMAGNTTAYCPLEAFGTQMSNSSFLVVLSFLEMTRLSATVDEDVEHRNVTHRHR